MIKIPYYDADVVSAYDANVRILLTEHKRKLKSGIEYKTILEKYDELHKKLVEKFKLDESIEPSVFTYTPESMDKIERFLSTYDVKNKNTKLDCEIYNICVYISSNSEGLYNGLKTKFNKTATKTLIQECINKSDIYPMFSILQGQFTVYDFILYNIKTRVCPYCNRNYTFAYISGSSSKRIAFDINLDHVYPQGNVTENILAIFCISIYNLAPVCPTCNFRKSDNAFGHFNPFMDRIDVDVSFSSSRYSSFDSTSFDVIAKTGTNHQRDSQIIDILDLNRIYSGHSREFLDLLERYRIFGTADRIREISNLTTVSVDTLLALIYGNSDYENESLGYIKKLIIDKLKGDLQ
ncbi:hypothetical protein G7061_08315 [Erysipelothrix sp. HDW6B]|uniref:hypothetical protein n=1 Tax=Erysipelothrix sp. HDW6B TaxID=2714929 RepID=UPI00140CF6A7|nr:hypothetical protein [Erysipelothrix sp. HDW6B]QIK86611.1 hypothetical protein G7061_08315 [Erysipelothrix sp. HDW6B]